MHQPLVSIITPNYNASKFVKATIDSVLAQTYTNWEMLIVDDCSSDDSLNIINKYVEIDSRITLIQMDENSGPAKTRNIGIEKAKGDFIAFLDSDDRWFSNKLKNQLQFMVDNDVALSFTSYESVDEEMKNSKVLFAKSEVNYSDLLTNNYIGCLTAMYSVSKLGKVYMPDVLKRQDWALWLKITKKGIVAFSLQEILASYTRRQNSVSSNKIKLLKYNWYIYRNVEQINFLKSIYYFIILFIKKINK